MCYVNCLLSTFTSLNLHLHIRKYFALKARNNFVSRMNSCLCRNKRQASYHPPVGTVPPNKQNSKSTSLKQQQQQ